MPVRLQEKALRGAATVSPKPTYPQASLDGKVRGVVVADLSIAADGRVAAVEILEAPDDAMRAAVVDACKQWVVPGRWGRGVKRRGLEQES